MDDKYIFAPPSENNGAIYKDISGFDNAYVIPYTKEQQEQIHAEVMKNLSRLDGTTRSRVKLLSGMTDEEIAELGGL